MPLEVCRISRSLRSTVCKQEYYSAPDKGFCASQQTCYYGYKLHVVCSLEGVIRSFDLSKASVHDIYYLKNVKELYRDCVLLDDRGYLSTDYRLDLFESQRIVLEVPIRRNQNDYKLQHPLFRRCRKRIETLFSQLCDPFMIQRNLCQIIQRIQNQDNRLNAQRGTSIFFYLLLSTFSAATAFTENISRNSKHSLHASPEHAMSQRLKNGSNSTPRCRLFAGQHKEAN